MIETQFYILITIFSLMGLPALLFSLKRGTDPARKRLLWSLLLLGGMLLLRFGGNYVLSMFDMGWRLVPREFMSFLCLALLVLSVFFCAQTLALPQEDTPRHSLAYLGSLLSMFLATSFVFLLMCGLSMDRLNESTVTMEGQALIRESKLNGGAVRRFYLPVNFLVHGQELEYNWETNQVTFPS